MLKEEAEALKDDLNAIERRMNEIGVKRNVDEEAPRVPGIWLWIGLF